MPFEPLLKLNHRILTTKQKSLYKVRLGARGEEQAVEYLEKNGYSVVSRNCRVGNHEVDIICLDQAQSILIFCEVKTRKTSFFGDPSRAVDQKKIQSMQVVARTFLKRKHWTAEYRFDVIAVLPDSIAHFENVSW